MAREHGECEPRYAAAAQLRAACPEPPRAARVAAAPQPRAPDCCLR